MASLLSLAPEIFNLITSCLGVTDLVKLAQTCKHYHLTLLARIYKLDIISAQRALSWAVTHGFSSTARKSIEAYEALGMRIPRRCFRVGRFVYNYDWTEEREQNQQGLFYLQIAVQDRRRDLAALLLEHGFDPDDKDFYGHTALHYAAKHKDHLMVDLLLGAGCMVDVKNRVGTTPLMYAAELGNLKALERLLFRGADAKAADRSGATALQRSLKGRNTDIIKLLLKYGANINAEDSNGFSPLMHAACIGRVNSMRTLINHGADLSRSGHKALAEAVRHDHEAAVRLLLQRRVSIQETFAGQTVLHLAARYSSVAIVDILLSAGADADATDCSGTTPLFAACVRPDGKALAIVRFLLDHGASTHIASASGEQAFHRAVKAQNIVLIEELLVRGTIEVGATDRKGRAGIHYASKEGNIDVVRYLISSGALPNATDAHGRTAAHYALSNGHLDVFQCLREAGADIGRKDCFGYTAADICGLGFV